jgi:hypothetical protein
MFTVVDVKCPIGPRELLSRIKVDPDAPKPYVNDSNLMCLKCSFCTRTARKQDPRILRVIHEFNFIGELVDSTIEYR